MNIPYTSTVSTAIPMATCQHCGNIHTGQCQRVKAIEYYENGKVRRVEYFDLQPAVGAPFVQTPNPLDPPYVITCLTFTHDTLVRDWSAVAIGDPPGTCSTNSVTINAVLNERKELWQRLAHD